MFTKDVAKNGYDDCVYLVQILFNKLSKQYKGFESGKISGTLDDITQRNLRQFQSISNLDPHGELDRDTWEMIAVYYNNF